MSQRITLIAILASLAACAGCASGNPFYVPPEYRDTPSPPAAYVPRFPVYTIPGGATYQRITPFYSIPYEGPRP